MAPKKQLVTEADVRRMGPEVRELVLGDQRIATPAALDLAFARGMRVIYGASGDGGGVPPSALWERMKNTDGTYVVQTENGRAVVTRIGAAGPEPFGSEDR